MNSGAVFPKEFGQEQLLQNIGSSNAETELDRLEVWKFLGKVSKYFFLR